MPVDTDVFDSVQVFALLGVMGDDSHDDHAAEHVKAVDARGGEVEGPEDTGGDRYGVMVGIIPMGKDFRGILVKLHAHEDAAPYDRPPNVLERRLEVVFSGCFVGEDDKVTGGQQNERIDGSAPEFGLGGLTRPLITVVQAIHQERCQQAAEYDDFRSNDPPDAQSSGGDAGHAA